MKVPRKYIAAFFLILGIEVKSVLTRECLVGEVEPGHQGLVSPLRAVQKLAQVVHRRRRSHPVPDTRHSLQRCYDSSSADISFTAS
jgi:hypothetical protein